MASPVFPGTVLVMGAGNIGCFVGGQLAAAGAQVSFVVRPRVHTALVQRGLTLSDLDGSHRHLPASALRLLAGVPQGEAFALVLLTVKSGATATAAAELAAALPPGTLVLSLQNGVDNAAIAQAAAPSLRVLPGMVPYNIAEEGPGRYHRGTTGRLAAQDDAALQPWLPGFAHAGLPLELHADLRPVLWGKLLLNLNNPVNALSGLPLRDQLLDRGYRRCLAGLMEETLGVLARAGVQPAPVSPVPPRWLPALLRLPTPLFRLLAARMLRIDARARSSMADDLRLGRTSEIDALCGAVVRLAQAHGLRAPRNQHMVELMQHQAERPRPMPSARLQAVLASG
jgi:2-dehydropantoate 2-reductase